MKKSFIIYIAVIVCFAYKSFAQPQFYTPFIHKQVLAVLPVKQASNVLSKMKPVYAAGNQQVLALRNHTQEQISKTLALCPAKKIAKPILILDAERANNFTANLEWETKYAFNARGFSIEKSLADSFHFTPVHFAKTAAGGGLKKNYKHPDNNHFNGISFYRVKLLISDTAYLYSNIASVKGYEDGVFSIYPNPATEKVVIQFIANINGNCIIMLYDASGKIMQQQFLNCAKSVYAQKSMDVSNLTAGVYHIKIMMPDKTFLAGKFVKE